MADPDLPDKLRAGRPELVIQCGACLQGCLVGVKSGKGIGCLVNPEVGREGDEIAPAAARRHVVVVGAGPAGLTAARVAAQRGHRLTVIERSERGLGGRFALSHLAPGKQAMRRTVESFIRLATHDGARVLMGMEGTPDRIAELAPDVVVVATGAVPLVPPIPGLEEHATGEQILTGSVEAGPAVLVIGGGLVGIEVAEWLAERDHQVVVVEMLADIARDMEPITRATTLRRLAGLPVTVHVDTSVVRIAGGYARVQGADGERELGPFDTVVVAAGTRPVDPLSAPLRARGIEVHAVGDAREIGQVQGAVRSAWELAARL